MLGEKSLKIAFIWYWNKASWVFDNWRDGLRAAMEEVAKDHTVGWFLDETMPDPEEDWDFILIWCDAQSRGLDKLSRYSCKKGICLTAMPQSYDLLHRVDVVFCESQPIVDAVKSQGFRAIKAFGTDTDFFRPNLKVKKRIEYFYPATFSPWKRQSEIAYLGNRLSCVGTVQPDGQQELEACKKSGVNVTVGYLPAKEIRDYFQFTEKMIIPAVHGSERTMLEALSTGIVPEVTHPFENPKLQSYLDEYKASGLSPRDFVLKNYSHRIYAEQLLKGINQ